MGKELQDQTDDLIVASIKKQQAKRGGSTEDYVLQVREGREGAEERFMSCGRTL